MIRLNLRGLVGVTHEQIFRGRNGYTKLLAPPPPGGHQVRPLFASLVTPFYRAYLIKSLEWEGGRWLPAAQILRSEVTDRDTELQLKDLDLKGKDAAMAGYAIDLADRLIEGEERDSYLVLLRVTNLRHKNRRLDPHWLRSLTPEEVEYVNDEEGGLLK